MVDDLFYEVGVCVSWHLAGMDVAQTTGSKKGIIGFTRQSERHAAHLAASHGLCLNKRAFIATKHK